MGGRGRRVVGVDRAPIDQACRERLKLGCDVGISRLRRRVQGRVSLNVLVARVVNDVVL